VFPLRGTREWARRDSLARESAAGRMSASPVRSASFKSRRVRFVGPFFFFRFRF